MLRLATGEGVKRESFIEYYLNFNFEKNWIQNLLNLNDKNWEKFINKNHIEINKLIDEIKEIANEHLDKIEALLDGDHDKVFQESLFNLAKFSLFRSI